MRFRQKVFYIFWKTELLKEKKIKRQIPKTFSFEMQNSKSWSNNFLKHLQLLFPLVLEGHKKTEKTNEQILQALLRKHKQGIWMYTSIFTDRRLSETVIVQNG